MQELTEDSLKDSSPTQPGNNSLKSAGQNRESGAAGTPATEPELSEAELAEDSWRYAEALNRQSRELEHQDIMRLRELLSRVDVPYPQPADIRALRAFLTDRPWLWKIAGDPARQDAARLLRAAKLPPAAREVAKAAVIDILNSVYNPMASPIEQLLAEQVALRWLHLTIIEHQYGEALAKDEGSLSNALYWERRLTDAHGRYSRALRSLHSVQPPSNRKPVQYQFDWTKPDELHTQDRFNRFDLRRFYENSWPNIFPDDEPSP